MKHTKRQYNNNTDSHILINKYLQTFLNLKKNIVYEHEGFKIQLLTDILIYVQQF